MKKMQLVALLLCYGLIAQAQVAVDSSNILLNGQDIPHFKIITMDGKTVQSNDLKGKIVMINFFATWCGSCRKELPFVKSEIWDKYKDHKDFILLIISREEAPEKVIPFVNENNFPMSFYSDVDRSCYRQFAQKYIPRNYLFDKGGKLIYQSKGFIKSEFDKLVNALSLQLD